MISYSRIQTVNSFALRLRYLKSLCSSHYHNSQMSPYCWLYWFSEQLHKEVKDVWTNRGRDKSVIHSRSLRKYVLDPSRLSSIPLPHVFSQLSLLGNALILNDSSNGISSILSQDHYRFIQAFPATEHWVCQHKFPFLTLSSPSPHPSPSR